jgi:hypothetical protein
MPNEFGPNRDRYPAEGGTFWLLTERHDSGEWVRTIRTKGDWPLVGAMVIGIEVARINSHVAGRYPGLAELMVDRLNQAEPAESLSAFVSANRTPTHP